jgi:membrane fusion protein, copper/silver efflux system
MKFIAPLLALLLFAAVPLSMISCSKPTASKVAKKTLYTCAMHPQIIQDHPGDCPICGMHLEPVRSQPAGEGAQAGVASDPAISIDPVTIQNMGIRTDTVKRGPLKKVIRMVGTIEYNETALTDVTVKAKGWIERLMVDTTGQAVKKGDPLFEIYSPDLVTAQNEYLIALGAGGASANLKASALRRLAYFDISADQIATLEQTRTIKRTLTVTAPASGIVAEKKAIKGQMVEPGMTLYRLADLATVWVQAQVYEHDLPDVKEGQEAEMTLTYLPGRKVPGRVTYVYPTLDEKTRTGKVRMEFPNPSLEMKPGMFASVAVKAELSPAALLVPDTAILRSGETNTVFIALDGGRFEPRIVTIGARGEGGVYEALTGLREGDRVVTSGQFMLDSESQLKEAIQKMTEPNSGATPTSKDSPDKIHSAHP